MGQIKSALATLVLVAVVVGGPIVAVSGNLNKDTLQNSLKEATKESSFSYKLVGERGPREIPFTDEEKENQSNFDKKIDKRLRSNLALGSNKVYEVEGENKSFIVEVDRKHLVVQTYDLSKISEEEALNRLNVK